MNTKLIARIFEDVGGYYVCSDSNEHLDTRGLAHQSKASALRSASQLGYTHARGSGTYRGNDLTKLEVSK